MSLDKNKSLVLVHWPQGSPSLESFADAGAVNEALARNKKTHVVFAAMGGAGTLNLATTFVSDPDAGFTYNVEREDGYELYVTITAGAVNTLTLGTGFGTASVDSINGTKTFKFERINGLYYLVG